MTCTNQTYEALKEDGDYAYWCDPKRLVSDAVAFQRVWRSFATTYAGTTPHEGYGILRKWCEGKDHFVYTSNVDSFFIKSGFDRARVNEIHGNGSEPWFCGSSIGVIGDEARIGFEVSRRLSNTKRSHTFSYNLNIYIYIFDSFAV